MKLPSSRLSIGAKLTALSSVLVVLAFALFTALALSSMKRESDERIVATLSAQTEQVLQMMTLYDASLRTSAEVSSQLLAARFPEKFSLDATAVASVGGVDTPVLRSGDRVVNDEVTIVDRFAADTGATATIYARKGADLIGVATSMKKPDGARALGITLDRAHPAHDKLLAGEPFTGKTSLVGKDYMTRYVPLRNQAGEVVGALETGADLGEGLKSIRSMKSGETGYFFALDAAPGEAYGTLRVHPAKEGANILASRDSDGREFIKEILEKKTGVIQYPWLNKERGETAPRDKIVVYGRFAPWNWVIAGGSYVEEFSRASVRLRNMLVACAVAAILLLSALLYWAFRRLVSAPLKLAVEVATRVGAGDLTSRVEAGSEDEVGRLMLALGEMNASLTKIVVEVRSGTDAIATGSEEIASGNADLSQRTEQQAASLEETAASIVELSSTVQQNASNTKQANHLAAAACAVALRGGAVVGQVEHIMSTINDSSNKIGDIVGVIDELAFQTNILALNAAIEAAHAGEQGRGFAVVATEVRTLAQRSAAAATEIRHLIADSVQRVDDGTRLVGEAGKTMTEILSSVKRVSDIMGEISAAGAEQSSGIEQVNQAVMLIDQMTQQNAALVEQAAAATEAMHEQAQRLGEAVAIFKVSAEPRGQPEPARGERHGGAAAAGHLVLVAQHAAG